MTVSIIAAIKPLFEYCVKFEPLKVMTGVILILLSSITSGIGILLIIPLLASIGIDVGSTSLVSRVSDSFAMIADSFGITLQLHSVLIFYVCLLIAVASFSFLNSVTIMAIKQTFVVDLRKRLSHALFFTDWHYLNRQHMSDYMRVLLGQVNQSGECLILLLNLVSGTVLMTAYLVFSFFVSAKFTLIALGLALLFASVLLPLNRRIFSSGGISLRASKQLQRQVFENASSLKVIKSYSSEALYLNHLHQNSQLYEQQKLTMSKFNAFSHWLNLVCGAVTFAVLFYLAINWLALPLPDLLVLLFIFSRLMPHIANMQRWSQNLIHKLPVLSDINKALIGLESQAEVHNVKSGDINQYTVTFANSIKLVGVSFQHAPNKKPIIDDLNVEINVNQTVAIVGRSGAGKSTLADLISGLLTPDSGTIFVDDVPITEQSRCDWRKNIAYVTQEVLLFHKSVRDNLSWVRDTHGFGDGNLSDDELWEALDDANASGFVRQMPQGLDTIVGDRGVLLSGGERQRLSLARALLSKPSLLILDEATSALDYESEIEIRDALINLNGRLTIIIISHNETTIEHVRDRIMLGTE